LINLKDALSDFIGEQEWHNVRLKKYGYYDKIKMKLTNSGKDVRKAFELLKLFEQLTKDKKLEYNGTLFPVNKIKNLSVTSKIDAENLNKSQHHYYNTL